MSSGLPVDGEKPREMEDRLTKLLLLLGSIVISQATVRRKLLENRQYERIANQLTSLAILSNKTF